MMHSEFRSPALNVTPAKFKSTLFSVLPLYEPETAGRFTEYTEKCYVEFKTGNIGSGYATVHGYVYGDQRPQGADGPVIIICSQQDQPLFFGIVVDKSRVLRDVPYLPESLSLSVATYEAETEAGRRQMEWASYTYIYRIKHIQSVAEQTMREYLEEFKKALDEVRKTEKNARIEDWQVMVDDDDKEVALRWRLGS